MEKKYFNFNFNFNLKVNIQSNLIESNLIYNLENPVSLVTHTTKTGA